MSPLSGLGENHGTRVVPACREARAARLRMRREVHSAEHGRDGPHPRRPPRVEARWARARHVGCVGWRCVPCSVPAGGGRLEPRRQPPYAAVA
jgi:hypothetical protein